MRFITTSEITVNHAFLAEVVFLLKGSVIRNRNLEESISVKTYCQIEESTDESPDQVKMVEYKCTGDTEGKNLDNYEINGIVSNTSSDEVKINNFEEVVNEINFEQLENKTNSEFTLSKLSKYITFKIEF